MKIGFCPESIVGLDGMPLVGRVTLYVHDSDDILDVFTLEGDTFTKAANPQLLNDAGRLDATLFFDAAIVDVKVEQYVGAEGQMSVDSPDDDFEQFDHFEIGFDPGMLAVRTSVDTIAELMDASPESGLVNVVGYYAVGDCVPRTYYWDKDSVNDIDGGYVVGSNVSDTGRWILLWGDEMMPSSVYGIVPGSNEANINALLTYPQLVGSFLQKTAPVVRFLPGNYTSSVTYSTTKEVAIDSGVKFTGASFNLPRARVLGPVTDYIADFRFTDPTSEAHSAWFKSASWFWGCGAKYMYVDGTNHFTDSSVSSAITIQNANVFGKGRIVLSYSAGAYLHFNGCNISAEKFLHPSDDVVKFSSMRWKDLWWTNSASSNLDFGRISDGHRIEFLSAASNSITLNDFGSADVYVRARVADVKNTPLNPDRKLFLDGRMLSSLDVDCFEEIHDCTVTGMCRVSDSDNGGSQVSLYNVAASSFVSVADILVLENSRIAFVVDALGSGSAVNHIEARNSSISAQSGSSYPWDCSPSIDAYGCEWSLSITPATDDTADTASVSFRDCYLHGCHLTYKHSYFDSCRVENCNLEVFPYQESAVYRIQFSMLNCTVKGGTPISLKKYEDSSLDNVKDVVPDIQFVGNRFIGIGGNSQGVTMPYYANATNQSLFIRAGVLDGSAADGAVIVYKDNVGDCPQDSATFRFYATFSQVGVYDTTLIGEIGATAYSCAQILRACPYFSSKSRKSGWNFANRTQYYSDLGPSSISPSNSWGANLVNAVQLSSFQNNNDFFELAIALTNSPSGTPGYM